MATKTDRILGYLPGTFLAAADPSALRSVAGAAGNELQAAENSLAAVMRAHWVDHADRGAHQIDDLARIAALYGLAPRRANGEAEGVEAFREHLKRYVRTFLDGTATVEGILRVTAEVLGLILDDAPLDGWWLPGNEVQIDAAPGGAGQTISRRFVTRATFADEAARTLLGFVSRAAQGTAATHARLAGRRDLSRGVDLSAGSRLRLTVDGGPVVVADGAGARPRTTLLGEVTKAINLALQAATPGLPDVAFDAGGFLALVSPTAGPASRIVLVPPAVGETDIRRTLFGAAPDVATGSAAAPAAITGEADLLSPVDLADRPWLRLAVDGGAPFAVQVAGAAPGKTFLDEVVAALNAQAAGRRHRHCRRPAAPHLPDRRGGEPDRGPAAALPGGPGVSAGARLGPLHGAPRRPADDPRARRRRRLGNGRDPAAARRLRAGAREPRRRLGGAGLGSPSPRARRRGSGSKLYGGKLRAARVAADGTLTALPDAAVLVRPLAAGLALPPLSLPRGRSQWLYLDGGGSRFDAARFNAARFAGPPSEAPGVFDVSRFHPAPGPLQAVFAGAGDPAAPAAEVTVGWQSHRPGAFVVNLPADLPARFGGRFGTARFGAAIPETFPNVVLGPAGDPRGLEKAAAALRAGPGHPGRAAADRLRTRGAPLPHPAPLDPGGRRPGRQPLPQGAGDVRRRPNPGARERGLGQRDRRLRPAGGTRFLGGRRPLPRRPFRERPPGGARPAAPRSRQRPPRCRPRRHPGG